MAATIARTTARTLIDPVGLSLGRRIFTNRRVETTRGDMGTRHCLLRRTPSFEYFAKHREESTSQRASPQVLAKTATVMDQSIENGVK
jgi:hypothetical protein